MKIFILILMIISSFGCQTTSTNFPKQEDQVQVASDSAIQSPITVQSSNPGEVVLKVEVVENLSLSGKKICGESKKSAYMIKVLEISEMGQGIVHLPKNNDEILVHFLFAKEPFRIGALLEVKAKESLCLDASKSYFTVISHKILE